MSERPTAPSQSDRVDPVALADPAGPADSTSEEHEALCRRCGMSCHFAVPVNGLAVVIDELRCKFLARDSDGRFLCRVYERRFDAAPWCHTAHSALSGGFLAQDCPYARGMAGYRGKVRLSPALLRKVLPAIRAEVARVGAPIGADPDVVAAFLGQGTAPWAYRVSADGARYLFTPADQPTPEGASASASAGTAADPPRPEAPARRSAKLQVL